MNSSLMVGMQSFYLDQFLDEGLENSLRNMKDQGGVNMLPLSTHIDFQSTKAWGPLPHARAKFFNTEGFNCEIHPEFYENTKIKPVKIPNPALNSRDVFGEVVEAANNSGIQVYALILHRFPEVENYPEINMRAVNNESIPVTLCHNHPDVRNFYKCLIDHLDAKYNLHGFCFALLDHYSLFGFQTLSDELADTLGIKLFSNPEMGLSCFCEICVQEATEKGVNVKKIREGLLKGVHLGYIPHKVEMMKTADEALRFLLDVPEYLEWLSFRSKVLTRIHRELYEHIQNKPKAYKVGLDIYGAKDDWKYQTRFQELSQYCDWIKPMFYSCTYKESLGPIEIGEGVKLAKELSGKPIYPGINCLTSEPSEKIQEGIAHSLNNGADGVILSWDYSLIPFEHLRTAKKELLKQSVL